MRPVPAKALRFRRLIPLCNQVSEKMDIVESGSFETSSRCMAMHNDSVFRAAEDRLEVCNAAGEQTPARWVAAGEQTPARWVGRWPSRAHPRFPSRASLPYGGHLPTTVAVLMTHEGMSAAP